jgi:hypothetical protein
MLLPCEESAPAQKGEKRQERKPENGEVISLDALEQMDPQSLQLIGTNAGQGLRSSRIEIGLDELIGHAPHGETRGLHTCEQHVLARRYNNGRMQFVGVTRECTQLLTRACPIVRFIEPSGV